MDYCNNVNYFLRNFDHPMKAKLVFLAAIVNNDTFRATRPAANVTVGYARAV